jgi:Flp pilus assembly protein TadG
MYAGKLTVLSVQAKPQLQRQCGQILVLVAIALSVLIGLVGLAIDSGLAYGVKAKLASAVDAASIAGARALAEGVDDAARIAAARTAAKDYYAANFPAIFMGAERIPLTDDMISAVHDATGYWTVTVTGSAIMPVTFMRLLGFSAFPISAMGQSIRRDLDIILVLDTSGSLASPTSTFPALKAAAINFVNKFNAGTNGDRVGVVSFASGAVVTVPIVKDGTRGFNRQQVIAAITALSVSGSTASAEGLRLALNDINGVPAINRSSLRMIVFFSDGAPNDVPATFCDGAANCLVSSQVTGDLYSETSSPGSSRATRVFRNDQRDTQIGTFSNISTLPTAGFAVTDVGNINLASYNNRRTLSGSPYINTRCNVNKAARNMTENVANTARSQDVKIHSIALGSAVNTLEINFCSYTSSEVGSSLLKRLSNTPDSDAYNPAQPTGLYVWAENAADLDTAFTSIASEILRLSR